MIAMDGPAQGRVLAFGGETWVWARAIGGGPARAPQVLETGHLLARSQGKQGRQPGQAEPRPPPLGSGPEAGDDRHRTRCQGYPIDRPDVRDQGRARRPDPTSEPVELYTQGDEAKGSYAASRRRAITRSTVVARRTARRSAATRAVPRLPGRPRDGEPVRRPRACAGRSPRSPAASRFPRRLGKYLKGIDQSIYTEYLSPTEHRVWDNWPFLLDLHRPADAGMVAPEATRLGLRPDSKQNDNGPIMRSTRKRRPTSALNNASAGTNILSIAAFSHFRSSPFQPDYDACPYWV